MAADQDRQNGDVQQTGGEQQRNRELVPGEGSQVNYTASTLEERDLRRQQIVDELREVDRKIEASNGYRVRNRRQFLEKSYFVFDANHLNLRYVLDEFEQPGFIASRPCRRISMDGFAVCVTVLVPGFLPLLPGFAGGRTAG